MAHAFNEEEREDLLERGFDNKQIEFLESLEMNTEGMYSDICKRMDDYGDSPSKIIFDYQQENRIPITGGKRRRTKRRKSKRRSSKKRSNGRRSSKKRRR
jgi:hypothetical protein